MDGQDLGSAIREIERLTTAAAKSTVLEVKGERSGVYYLVGPNGEAVKHTADPGWHSEKLATPADLRKFIIDQDATDDATFYDETRVVWVRNLADRRDTATCALIQSPQFRWLQECGGNPMSQADFVRVLRITFRGCFPVDSNLLPLVRNLKFNAASESAANIQHGRESIGRSVMAAVTGEAAVPEEVTLNVPVFENHLYRDRVACALEVLPHEQAFRLTPFPLEVRQAFDGALENVRDLLSNDEALPPIYRGQP